MDTKGIDRGGASLVLGTCMSLVLLQFKLAVFAAIFKRLGVIVCVADGDMLLGTGSISESFVVTVSALNRTNWCEIFCHSKLLVQDTTKTQEKREYFQEEKLTPGFFLSAATKVGLHTIL